MIDRNKAVVGLFAILAAASAIGFGIMFTYLGRDSCLDGSDSGASCPALAVVNGTRYGVGVSRPLRVSTDDLTPYAEISQTNVRDNFAEMTAYALAGVDPSAALVAKSAQRLDVAFEYRLMFVTGGKRSEAAWPAICRYFIEEVRAADDRCPDPSPTASVP